MPPAAEAGPGRGGGERVNFVAEGAVAQGMILASLVGGLALTIIAQLVAAFPDEGADRAGDAVGAAVTRFALAATVMMINVWSGIVFFMDDGGDRIPIAAIFYGGLLVGVVLFATGMAEMVAIRTRRLRRPLLLMFGVLLLAEAGLALAFLV